MITSSTALRRGLDLFDQGFLPVIPDNIRNFKNAVVFLRLAIDTVANVRSFLHGYNPVSAAAAAEHNRTLLSRQSEALCEDLESMDAAQVEAVQAVMKACASKYKIACGEKAELTQDFSNWEKRVAARAEKLDLKRKEALDRVNRLSDQYAAESSDKMAEKRLGVVTRKEALERLETGTHAEIARLNRHAQTKEDAAISAANSETAQAIAAERDKYSERRTQASRSASRSLRGMSSTGRVNKLSVPPVPKDLELIAELPERPWTHVAYATVYDVFRDNSNLTTMPQEPCRSESVMALIKAVRNPANNGPENKMVAANALLAPLRKEESVMQALAMVLAYANLPQDAQTPLHLRTSGKLLSGAASARDAHYTVIAPPINNHEVKAVLLRARETLEPSVVLLQGTQPEATHGFLADLDKDGVGRTAFEMNQELLCGWVQQELNEGREVQIVGHSLGAALASRLYASVVVDLSAADRSRTHAWLFSPPGLELGAFDKLPQRLDPNIRMFWHEADIVKTAGNAHAPGTLCEYTCEVESPLDPHVEPALVLAEMGQLGKALQWRMRDMQANPSPFHRFCNLSEIVRATGGRAMNHGLYGVDRVVARTRHSL